MYAETYPPGTQATYEHRALFRVCDLCAESEPSGRISLVLPFRTYNVNNNSNNSNINDTITNNYNSSGNSSSVD